MGGDVESVLKEVGLADDEGAGPGRGKGKQVEEDRAWLHCIVGGRLDEKQKQDGVAGADEEEVSDWLAGVRLALENIELITMIVDHGTPPAWL